jgi:hypothetical protein
MRSPWSKRDLVSLALMVTVSACSSTEPPTSQSRTATISMSALAVGTYYNCYEVWSDSNGDLIPDTDSGQRFCLLSSYTHGAPVPWRFSLSISVIHAGTSTEQVVTSVDGLSGSSVKPGDAIDDFVSLTTYDPDVLPPDQTAPDPTPPDYYFVQGKRVSVGSPVYQRFLYGISDPADPRYNYPIGVPNILTAPSFFTFNVTSGDTVIVRARKQYLANAPGFITYEGPDLKISASISIGGGAVVTSGPTTSGAEDGSGFTFSFAVQ